MHDHKKHAGLRINRNDMVRYLIDQATLDSLAGIKRLVKRTTTHSQEQPNTTLKKDSALTREIHHFKKWIRSHDHPQDTDFLLMANCLNMRHADSKRRTCAALATRMKICTSFKMPGDQ